MNKNDIALNTVFPMKMSILDMIMSPDAMFFIQNFDNCMALIPHNEVVKINEKRLNITCNKEDSATFSIAAVVQSVKAFALHAADWDNRYKWMPRVTYA